MSEPLTLLTSLSDTNENTPDSNRQNSEASELLSRLERLPLTRPVKKARAIVGMATFFDGYTTLAIAYAMPILHQVWQLNSGATAAIISSGYAGQLLGALFFGWLAERIGRLPVLLMTIVIFAVMSTACVFAWDAPSMIAFRFLQGIGTGGEVPVASAYVNELSSSEQRGRFFLLYELLFLIGLVFAGMIGYTLVPLLGWKAMFIIGTVPLLLVVPFTFRLFESPRWLIEHGQTKRAAAIITRLEASARQYGQSLADFKPSSRTVECMKPKGSLREMLGRFYGPRTLLLWVLWFGTYLINNGLVTWLPTLYRTVFGLPVRQAIGLGFGMTSLACLAALVCALCIDKVGRRRWYAGALGGASVALFTLYAVGAPGVAYVFIFTTITYSCVQTITYSLYLYSAELYPTRLRATGAGFGSAWLRAGSMAGPWLIGLIVDSHAITYVFMVFGVIATLTGVVCWLFAPETTGRSLEELSP